MWTFTSMLTMKPGSSSHQMRHDSQLVSYLRLRTQGDSTLILRVSPYKSGWGWSRRSCRQEPVWFMRSEVLVPIRERLPCPPAPWSSTTTMYLPANLLIWTLGRLNLSLSERMFKMFRMFGMSLQWLQVSAVAIDKNYKITDQSGISLTGLD